MKKPMWAYVSNQFLNSTKKSFRKALKLSYEHDKALYQKTIDFPAEPKWGVVYARYHVEHLAYDAAYNKWKASGGNLMGDTQALKDLLKVIPRMLDKWLSAIIPVYDRTTAKFKALFPNGRTPFEVGSYFLRITAVKTLSTTMGTDSGLAPAKTLVDADFVLLEGALGEKTGEKTSKKSLSDALEVARVSAMIMIYRDLGFLIDAFGATPAIIETVFDLETLRNTIQSLFTKTMATTESYSITKNTFKAGEELRLKIADAGNPTDGATIYLASTLGGIDSTGITVLNNAERKFDPIEFKVDLATHPFLTLVTTANLTILKTAVELY